MSYTGSLLNFINSSTSAYHAVLTAQNYLLRNHFVNLNLSDDWQLNAEQKYFVKVYDSTLVAFIPHQNLRDGIRLAVSHTDFPCLKLKPKAQVIQDGYGKLNTEVYGGMILNTWLDRPLSLAGKVVLKSEDIFNPKVEFIDFKRPLMTVPNLAVHMDRTVNTGKSLNKQKEMLPLAFMQADTAEDRQDCLLSLLAQQIHCEKEAVLSYDLTVYQAENPCYLGFNSEFISASRLDNMTSVKACVEGIVAGKRKTGLDVIVLFDNEEVGSRTKQGGASLLLLNVLERIYQACGYSRTAFLADLAKSFMLSVDVAHGLHPNYPEKNDITNKPILNHGVVIKTAASQSYAGDAEAVAIIKSMCDKYKIDYQMYVNRSDIAGGSTIGSMASALLTMRTLDIGVPILAMHSARETMGKTDQRSLEFLVRAFFEGL